MARPRKLLIVEDNLLNAQILSTILEEEYETVWAENGQKALEVLRREKARLSLVLLDLVMPIMDGYTFLQCVRAEPELSVVPIIVMTQQESESDEVRALSLGAADFLTKPYKPQIIRHKVANIINLRETAALVNQVEKDGLTGLLNKEFFYQKAEKILAEDPDRPYDIFCCDVENFKLVNDLFGQDAGNELLRYIAGMLSSLTPEGGLCGRVGADTFVMLIPGEVQYLENYFEEAQAHLNEFKLEIRLSLRAGVFHVAQRDISVSTMCDRAFLAANSIKGMYGKRYAVYDDEIRQKLLREQSLTDCMETALKEKQFEVWYQPKYRLKNGRIAGAEALVRWNHPQKGYLYPGEFISLFERNGFITKLDSYVWEQACAQLKQWNEAGYPPLPLSVNVSRADAYNPALPRILGDILCRYGIQPAQLHLEITETAYTENPRQIIEVAHELKHHGFLLEMDDFGSGYSSLNMLNELPIDLLKLDMKFLQNEKKGEGGKNILHFIIDLAKWMELPVVAEGVEMQDQADRLLNMDCEYAQGYLFAKPMPAEQYELLLKEEVARRQKEKGRRPAREEGGAAPDERPAILIVEEDEDYRRLQRQELGDQYRLFWEETGTAALQWLRRGDEAVQLVLLDSSRSSTDAYRALRAIRNEEAFANLPVLFSTPRQTADEDRALEMGADDFLAKPYTAAVLLHHLKGLQARRNFRGSREERAEEYRRLFEAANQDYLTGVLNRRGLDQAVARLRFEEGDGLCALYMLDLDDLKLSNDQHGHLHGDQRLKAFARYIKRSLRADDLVARVGGDEFVILMRQMPSAEAALHKGQRLCRDLERTVPIEGQPLSCSVGVTVFSGRPDLKKVIAQADNALYEAKRGGKGRCRLWRGSPTLGEHPLYKPPRREV